MGLTTTRTPSHAGTTAPEKHVKQRRDLQIYIDVLEPEDPDLNDDLLDSKSALVVESPDLLNSEAFYAPSLKSHKSILDEEIPSTSQIDYSNAFTGIDAFSKNNKGAEGDNDMVEAKTGTTNQKKNESSTTAADLLDHELFESAIRQNATTARSPPSNKEKLNLSTITVDLPHCELTELDPKTPSPSKELAAAGVSLGDETVGMGRATPQHR